MGVFAALDVSQEQTAACVVDTSGSIVAEAKVATCPDAIMGWLARWSETLEKVGLETGPLAVWLWNALSARGAPVVCLDARHANAALKMMPNKTDRHDARGLAQIVRTGWFKEVRIKSHGAYVVRALLTARDALVGMRVRLENEVRGLLKTFGVLFGKRVGGFMRRAEEIIAGELSIAPELRPVFEALVAARRAIVDQNPGARRPGARRSAPKSYGPPVHDHAGCRPDHRARRRCLLRRRFTLRAVIERRRLSWAHAEALRVRGDQSQRPHLPARRQDDQNPPLRGGERDHDAQARRIAPARMGACDRRAHRAKKGQGRAGP